MAEAAHHQHISPARTRHIEYGDSSACLVRDGRIEDRFHAFLARTFPLVHARLKLEKVGYLSAIITCFGLSLLLRADSAWGPGTYPRAVGGDLLLRYRVP